MSNSAEVVPIFIAIAGTVCGGWFIAFVAYPRLRDYYERLLARRVVRAIKKIDRWDAERKEMKRKMHSQEQL